VTDDVTADDKASDAQPDGAAGVLTSSAPVVPGTDPTPVSAPADSPRALDVESREPLVGTLTPGRQRPGLDILLVLGVSLGQSAVYSILSIINKLTYEVPLGQQTTTMNPSYTPDRPWLDLAYQVAAIVFPLVPAMLALYLLHLAGERRQIGFDLRRPGFDLGWGAVIFAAIGIPGLAFYYLAWTLGFNTQVSPANLAANWWTVPVLIGLAAMNGILEEVVMLGFFFSRAAALNWKPWVIIVSSAVIRGGYHLYQGFGGFIGNLVMGLVFGLLYLKFRRVGPLVVAHILLDVAAFVGYALIAPLVDWL
jgi:membrane protease YdiL (CAAX protease family)